jgi:hypothetical protein
VSAHPIVQFEIAGATEQDRAIIRERIKDMQPITRDENHFSILSSSSSAELLSLLRVGLSPQCSVRLLGRHTLVHDDPTFHG